MENDKVKEIVENLFDAQRNMTQQILERIWFRNILYYMGEQWFEWVRSGLTFQRVMPNANIPTPVSNIIRDYVRSMKSLVLNKDFVVSIWPNSNDQDDAEAAEMGETFLRWLEAANDESHLDEKEKEIIWMVICGTSFDRTFATMENDSWAIDGQGVPISTGDVMSQHISPFNVALDHYGETLRAKRYVGIKSLKPREWVEDTFKIKVGEGAQEGPTVNYERRLATLVANVSPWKGDGLDTSDAENNTEDLVVFKEIEIRPTKKDPYGVYAAMVGDQICFNHKRLPIPMDVAGKWYYTLTEFHYQYVPGRFWADSGVSDLISPQNSINQIDQDLETNRKGIGRPLVIVPTDMNMRRLTKYGQSLLVLQYDAMTSGGQRPEITRGTPLPPQVLNERDIHRGVAQDAAGDPKNVLRGQAPTQQASGIMVDILRDAAEQGHLPDIERFYRSLKRVKRKQLILAQEVYTEERLIKIPDQGGRAKAVAFKGADLRNNTDVRLELSSGAASTKTGQSQVLLKLTETGFFSSESDLDPEYRQDILRRMGLSGFKDKRNVDMERAQGENQLIVNTPPEDLELAHVPIPPDDENYDDDFIEIPVMRGLFLSMGALEEGGEPVVISDDPLFKYDNHAVHYETHRRFLLSNEFRHLPGPIQEIAIAHTDVHKTMMEVMAQDAMAREAQMTGNAQRIGTEAATPELGMEEEAPRPAARYQ